MPVIFVVLLILGWAASAIRTQPPNIVLIIADDLGWDDVGFHGSPHAKTPNLDHLAQNGVILTDYYVQPICTPTRSSIMTGKYPIRNGMQSSVIMTSQAWGLGTNETLLPERLKSKGYATHLVGKWHLGFFNETYLPTRRGFDSFYGMYSGRGDYWDYTSEDGDYIGLDLRKGDEVASDHGNNYSTAKLSSEAVKVIQKHNKAKPMFLTLSYLAIHSANSKQPLQAPEDKIKQFSHVNSKERQTVLAMGAAMDDGIGLVYAALEQQQLLDNTVIIFTTDNGAASNGFDKNYGSNFPLRGIKTSLFEGGVRGVGFVNSKLIESKGRLFGGLIHVTDWFPTILGLAGVNDHGPQPIDGHDQWPSISKNDNSPRNEVLLNIDDMIYRNSAIRIGQWKLVHQGSDEWDNWFTPPGYNHEGYRVLATKNDGTILCEPKPNNVPNCRNGCLFHLTTDPCEYEDLSQTNADDFSRLTSRLDAYRRQMVTPRYKGDVDPECDPDRHNGVWSPWINKPEGEANSATVTIPTNNHNNTSIDHAASHFKSRIHKKLSLNQKNIRSHYLYDY